MTHLPILYLLDFLRPGVGVPETLKLLIDPCRAAGIELHVGTLHRESGDLGDDLLRRNVPLVDLTAVFPRTERRLFKLWPYVRRHGIRVVHANEFRAIYLGLRLKTVRPSMRVVGHLRVTGNLHSDTGAREKWFAKNSRRLAGLVTVSQAVLDDFHATTGIRDFGRVILNGRPLERFGERMAAAERTARRAELGVGDARPLLLCVATLQGSKDHPTLLRAAAELAHTGPPFALRIAGDGPDRAALETLVDELRLRDRVALLGRRDDVPALMQAADLYVSASLREGLPGSVIEAQASGLPCVVTRCGGPEEVVADGTTGIVVPPADPVAMGRALANLLVAPALRAAMGEQARANAQRFRLDRMVTEWVALYRQVHAG